MNHREPTRWELLRWRCEEFWDRLGAAWDVLRGRARVVYPEEEELRFWIGEN